MLQAEYVSLYRNKVLIFRLSRNYPHFIGTKVQYHVHKRLPLEIYVVNLKKKQRYLNNNIRTFSVLLIFSYLFLETLGTNPFLSQIGTKNFLFRFQTAVRLLKGGERGLLWFPESLSPDYRP